MWIEIVKFLVWFLFLYGLFAAVIVAAAKWKKGDIAYTFKLFSVYLMIDVFLFALAATIMDRLS